MRRKPECGEKGVADLVKLNIDGHGVEVAPGTTIINEEIGRASCRERV